jgi:hypothetical protein
LGPVVVQPHFQFSRPTPRGTPRRHQSNRHVDRSRYTFKRKNYMNRTRRYARIGKGLIRGERVTTANLHEGPYHD